MAFLILTNCTCFFNIKKNFSANLDSSFQEEVLTKMLSGGKLAIKKQYESINSKEKDLTGRINNETILLKIVK